MNKTVTLRFFKTILPILFILLATATGSAQILTNGDFESGGSGNGFLVNNYTLINPLTGTSTPGFYARTANPALMNTAYDAGGDHTTGTGNMLVFDGAVPANQFFWTTGSTGGAIGGFTAGSTYIFSFWIKSVSSEVTADDATRANIGVFFVNASGINPANQNFLAPLPADGWVNIQYSFVATADNVLIRLKTNGGQTLGNDFAVDDFSIYEGGLPFEGAYTSVNPTCPTSTDGSITVNLSGGTLPYSAYSLTGAATQTNNNGIFTGLGNGDYTVTVSDADGNTYTQTITLEAQGDLVLSGPVMICPGDATTLTVSGGAGTYTWTANPADASLTDPSAGSQTVSPAATTTYTVTSGAVSDPTNLIQNGDFEQGDTLFTTEYNYVADPNPFGVQTAYAIVTSPAAWFAPFCDDGDHTTGSGNLMVFDGSTVPLANVLAWRNQTPVTVQPNTTYTFSYYVESVSAEDPARLEVLINGESQGLPISAPGVPCQWTQVSYNWNSGSATSATFAIYDRNFNSGGNDFALDDISFREATTCVYQKSVTVTVSPGTTPTFASVAPICSGDALSPLPATSTNGITGSWSPALNNTATTTYTFTPDAGQCASAATLTITVNSGTTPTFASVAPICSGDALPPLPTTSANGITGSWSPALNNMATTTYTFTPGAGQCASSATLTITVNSGTTPTFASVAPICSGDTLSPLPTTSTNGITGSWSPALNNMATTTYTFTPDAVQCASSATLTITVNPATVPAFTAIAPICAGSVIDPLPTTSENGITGHWSPAPDNTATTTYTFTPDAGQCASSATLTITVNDAPDFAVSQGCDGVRYMLTAMQDDAFGSVYTWTDPAGNIIGSDSSVAVSVSGTYQLTVAQNGCSATQDVEVSSTACTLQKGISANNDGLNDTFDLAGYDVKELKIYNRYGTAVYSKAGYQDEWYGQSDNGDELPDGTYYYLIDLADAKTKTGWIYINRAQ